MPKKSMHKKFLLTASNIELRPARTGVTIKVEEDNDELSGRLLVTQAGVTWIPKGFKQYGPNSIRIVWPDIPNVFSRYAKAPPPR